MFSRSESRQAKLQIGSFEFIEKGSLDSLVRTRKSDIAVMLQSTNPDEAKFAFGALAGSKTDQKLLFLIPALRADPTQSRRSLDAFAYLLGEKWKCVDTDTFPGLRAVWPTSTSHRQGLFESIQQCASNARSSDELWTGLNSVLDARIQSDETELDACEEIRCMMAASISAFKEDPDLEQVTFKPKPQ